MSAKTLFSLVPLVLLLFGLVGSWYVSKDRQERIEKEVEQLSDTVARLERDNAAGAGNGLVLEKVRDDVAKIKEDVATLRARLQ